MKKAILTVLLVISMIFTILVSISCGVECDINFIVNGQSYAVVQMGDDRTVSIPSDPILDGYTFDGWYWDDGIWEKPFTANSLLDAPLSSNMSVYAKFSVIHNHEYTKTVIEPTCTEQGYTVYNCI